MIFFVIYAGLVWYGALRERRRVMGFVYTLLGVVGVAFVGYLHYRLNIWTNGAICLPVLQSLLYPYGALVATVGVFLACLPPRYGGSCCRTCGYDLRGLETDDRVCPECATRHVLCHAVGEPCRACGARLRARDRDHALCGTCGTIHLILGAAGLDAEERVRAFDEREVEVPRRSIQERIRRHLKKV